MTTRRVIIEVTVEPEMSDPRDWDWQALFDDPEARFIAEVPVPPETKETKEFWLSRTGFDPGEPDNLNAQTWEITCPHCRTTGSIVEVDKAVRWNRLTVEMRPDGPYVHASLGDSADYHFAGWRCLFCDSENIDAPEGFEIEDWS